MISFNSTELPFGGFQADKDHAEYFLFGAPLDETGSYRSGYSEAPKKIREANANIETLNIFNHQDIAELLIHDAGDINFNSNKMSIPEKIELVSEVTREAFKNKKYPVIIGGEHTVLVGTSKAIPKGSTLLVLDAHADLRAEYDGNPLSHACAVRRAIENTEWEKIILFGVRAISSEEKEFLSMEDYSIYWAKDILKLSLSEIIELGKKLKKQTKNVFLSVDLDVFDPSIAPGVGNPEPMGLSASQVMFFINELAPVSIGLEVSEYIPNTDNSEITAFLAARLIHTILTAHYFGKRKEKQ